MLFDVRYFWFEQNSLFWALGINNIDIYFEGVWKQSNCDNDTLVW